MTDDDRGGAGDRDRGPGSPGDRDRGDGGLDDLRRRDDSDKKPSWLSTYGSPLWRIVLLVALLAGLIVLRKPCADGVAGFVGNFGQPPASQAARDGGGRPVPPAGGAPSGMTQRSGPAPRTGGHEGGPARAAGDAAPRH
ncbi:MAG: hypothetical protein HY906_10955 [Deltaproteobacteria bacterium]|nr:hypothetical protein [Deltaproteobacteria bacterium]